MGIVAKRSAQNGSREIITFALSRAFGEPELAMQASSMIASGSHSLRSVCETMGFDATRTEEIDLLYRSSLLGAFCAERLRERIEPLRMALPRVNDVTPSRLQDTIVLVETAKQAAAAVVGLRGNDPQLAELEPLASAFNRAQALCRRSGVSINNLLKVIERTNQWVTKLATEGSSAQAIVYKQARSNEVDSAKVMAMAATEPNAHARAVLESIAVLAAKTSAYYYAAVGADFIPNVQVPLYRDRKTNQVLDKLSYGRDGAGDHMQRQTILHLTSIPIGPAKDDRPTSDVLVGVGGNEFMHWHMDTVQQAQNETRQEWRLAASQAEASLILAARPRRGLVSVGGAP